MKMLLDQAMKAEWIGFPYQLALGEKNRIISRCRVRSRVHDNGNVGKASLGRRSSFSWHVI